MGAHTYSERIKESGGGSYLPSALKQNRIGWNFRRDKNVKSFLKWKSISFTIELENHLPPTFLPFFKKSKIQKF